MILKANAVSAINGRRPYELGDREIVVHHFVTRVTTPENPFTPHKHAVPELWFIVEGEALVTLDGAVTDVDVARKMAEELLEAQKGYLPNFNHG